MTRTDKAPSTLACTSSSCVVMLYLLLSLTSVVRYFAAGLVDKCPPGLFNPGEAGLQCVMYGPEIDENHDMVVHQAAVALQ